MDSKRGLVIFVFVIAFVIFSISFISSTTCDVRLASSCPAVNTVMKLSAQTNAHGASYNGAGNYQYALCCVGMKYYTATDNASMHTCDSNINNYVLKLSSTTNAHAQTLETMGGGYSTNICFGKFQCTFVTSASCPSTYTIPMVSLSATTNAHLAQFTGTGSYSTKICCNDTLSGPTPGNGRCEAGEACDDGNLNNGDGCSSTMSIESGYTCTACNPAGPSCCYRTNPRYAWFLNGNPFSGGAIRHGQLLKMTIYDDLCLPSGSGPTFTIYEGSSSRATNSSIVSSKTPGGEINSTYPISSSFLNALGSGSSDIFFRTTVNGKTYTSNTITVNPIYCGDGECESGENCLNCEQDCKCSSNQECSAGTCVNLCDLTSASWNYSTPVGSSIVSGTPVRLNILGTNCAGKTINFAVFEKDGALNPDDSVSISPSSITFPSSGTNAYLLWNSVYTPDTDGGQSDPPEYYFRASVSGYSESITSSNNGYDDPLLLKVNQRVTCGNGVCGVGEDCGNCAADCGCNSNQECSAGVCVPLCDLNTATWNYSTPVGSSIASGTPVRLQITSASGTNCAGKTISFSIFEKDGFANPDDPVTPGPPTITFPSSGTSAYVIWNSVYIPDNDGGQSDPPEYYFRASVSGYSETATSSNTADNDPLLLRVHQFVPCGNGVCGAGENCGNCPADCKCGALEQCNGGVCQTYCGNGVCDGTETTATCPGDCPPATCNNNGICGDISAETCATCPGDCQCGVLEQCNGGVCQTYCGNGVCDGTENCGNCAADCGCTGATRCEVGSCVPYCGNGICGDSAGEDCNGCVADCGCTAPQVCESNGLCTIKCDLKDASWSVNRVVAGNPVDLNIIGSNCGGKTINFEIFEKDGALNPDDDITLHGGTNPSPITFPDGEATTSATWTAFYMPDNDGGQSDPPEYYFRASVQGESISATSSNNGYDDPLLLKVFDPIMCVGISLCSHYTDEEMCNNDESFCNIADNEDATCGTSTYNPSTRCWTIVECGCSWNSDSKTCGPRQSIKNNCANCGNNVLEGDEVCDGTLLQLRDNSCTIFDAYTSGEVKCYASGEPEECTYDFSDCGPGPVCGNGVREEGEECDDGNTIDGDECSYPGCRDLKAGAVCGNGNIEEGEVCDGALLQLKSPECSNFDLYDDDGSVISCYPPGHENECRYDFSDCTPHQCGNGVLEEGEECDDGNTIDGDECSYPDCKLSTKGRPEVGECHWDPQGDEMCDGREFITRTFVGTWIFPPENEFT